MDVRMEESWRCVLADEFDRDYFRQLVSKVHEEYGTTGRHCYPPGPEIFAAFDQTPFDKVKVVIIGQDPYHGPGQANGLAFSVNDGVRIPPSLQNIFKEVNADTGAPIPANGDLTRWARQGVLLLNSTLTVREHEPRSHSGIGWERFTEAAIRKLATERENLVFLLWGSDAIRRGEFIDRSRHLVMSCVHPSPLSAHRGFFGNHQFSRANQYLAAHGKTTINW
ncbi:MAG: uracil-DNA glycosylase [Bacteroidales bacterium]|nr:uracil-DNA glycosylase [Bacteroidales bacterium]